MLPHCLKGVDGAPAPDRTPWSGLIPTKALGGCPAGHAGDAGSGTPSPKLFEQGVPPAALSSLADSPELSAPLEQGDLHRVDSLLRRAAARTGPRSPRLERGRRSPPT